MADMLQESDGEYCYRLCRAVGGLKYIMPKE